MSKKKYSEKKIGEIVRQYEEGVSPGQLEKIHGIHHRTIEGWIIKYKINGLSAFQEEKHNRHYSEKIKQQAVEDYLKGEGSQQAIAAKYGLRDRTQIHRWIKVYNSGRGFRRKMSGGSRMKEARPTTVEERIQIAKDCIANGGNYGEAALKFNVSYQQVYQWVKKFKEKGEAVLRIAVGNGSRTRHPEPGKKNWKLRLPNSNTNCI